MPRVRIPRSKDFLFPPVCVVTGATEGVYYRTSDLHSHALRRRHAPTRDPLVTFAKTALDPLAAAAEALAEPLPRVILRLPVTARGRARWIWGCWVALFLACGVSVALFFGARLFGVEPRGDGLVPWLLALMSLPPAVFFVWLELNAPRYLAHDSRSFTLWIPSRAAAKVIEDALGKRAGSEMRSRSARSRPAP